MGNLRRVPVRHSELFGGIAPRYDFMNRILSLGLDCVWRNRLAELVADSFSGCGEIAVLDIACGTGDLAIAVKRASPQSSIEGIDISEGMLDVARAKPEAVKAYRSMSIADASSIPFGDGSFDCAMCAFGFRNFPDRLAALKEASRVLRPGGMLFVLEFFKARSRFISALTSSWLWFAPRIFARSALEAYDHLRRSIGEMVDAGEFSRLAAQAGLKESRRQKLAPAATLIAYCKGLP